MRSFRCGQAIWREIHIYLGFILIVHVVWDIFISSFIIIGLFHLVQPSFSRYMYILPVYVYPMIIIQEPSHIPVAVRIGAILNDVCNPRTHTVNRVHK